MVTVTTLTAFEPANNTGSLHVQFSGYASTPDSGAVENGIVLFWAYRGVTLLDSWVGLVGGHATLEDGDIVYAQYIDGAGVAGDIVSYTFVVDQAWDGTLYMSSINGDDGYDGLSGTDDGGGVGPKATWDAVHDLYLASRAAGEKWRILVEAGSTVATTGMSTTAWCTLGSTTGHLHVDMYGSGAKPAFAGAASSTGSVFCSAQFGAMTATFANIAYDGTSSAGSNYFVDGQGAPITASTEANVCVINCDITRVNNVYVGPYATGYDPSRIDFHAWVDNTTDDFAGNAGHFYGNLTSAACVLFMGSESSQQGGANGFWRSNRCRYTAIINNVWDRATGFDTNVFRMGGGEDTVADDKAYRNLVHGNQFLGCNEAIEIEAALHPDEVSFEDFDLIGNYITQDAGVNYPIAFGGTNDDVSLRLTRIRVLCNQSNSDWLGLSGIAQDGSTTDTGHVESVLYAHNTAVIRGNGGIGVLLNMIGSTNIDNGSLSFFSNLLVTTGTGTGQRVLGSMTSSWVAASDYNHIVTAGGSIEWSNGISVATWQGLGFDANGTTSTSGTHNLTDLTFAAFDATPASGTGPQIGTGGGTVYIDAAGNLFVDDAGAFEYGGSAPDAPTSGGVSGTGAATLPLLTGAGQGSPVLVGIGAATLPLLTASGAGHSVVVGVGVATLPSLTAVGVGSPIIVAVGAATLPLLTAAGVGDSGDPAPTSTRRRSGLGLRPQLGL